MPTTTAVEVPTRNGARVDVAGVSTYYEVSGDGEPLLLLHGGMCTAETCDAQVGALASSYRVYVPERPGHGRTPDVDGPITYETMATHTIALMEALGIESAHLAGWSDGALVGLLVALRRPKLVRKLVLIDQFVTLAGAHAGYPGLMEAMTVDTLPPPLTALYGAVSPDGPEHFGVVFAKLHEMWVCETGIELADLAHVGAPTLVLVGDDGAVVLDHAVAVHRTLPQSQLAVVPGTSHGLVMEKPDLVNHLIADFLAPEQTPKLMSVSG